MKAVNRKTGQWFAVKMIQEPPKTSKPASKENAFAREIGIMEQLKHPNIVELKEVFLEENGNISTSDSDDGSSSFSSPFYKYRGPYACSSPFPPPSFRYYTIHPFSTPFSLAC